MSKDVEFREYLKSIRRKYYKYEKPERFKEIFSFSHTTFWRAEEGKSLLTPNNFLNLISALEKSGVPNEEIQELSSLYNASKEERENNRGISVEDSRQLKLLEDLKKYPFSLKLRPLLFTIIVSVLIIVGTISLSLFKEKELSNASWIPIYVNFNEITMVQVPPGCFIMGNLRENADEKPVQQLCFDQPFWIGKTEITNQQYGSPPDAGCNANQVDKISLVNGTGPEYPRNCVTWEEALAFCKKNDMRLPTEAEWEYAAKGPDNVLYPWGDTPNPAYAIVRTDVNDASKAGQMLPVGSKPQDISWVGATDMAGSLREFTSTIYDTVTVNGKIQFPYPYRFDDGREALQNNGTSVDLDKRDQDTTLRVVRGGNFDKTIDKATTTWRTAEYYDFRWNEYGFRCAKNS